SDAEGRIERERKEANPDELAGVSELREHLHVTVVNGAIVAVAAVREVILVVRGLVLLEADAKRVLGQHLQPDLPEMGPAHRRFLPNLVVGLDRLQTIDIALRNRYDEQRDGRACRERRDGGHAPILQHREHEYAAGNRDEPAEGKS